MRADKVAVGLVHVALSLRDAPDLGAHVGVVEARLEETGQREDAAWRSVISLVINVCLSDFGELVVVVEAHLAEAGMSGKYVNHSSYLFHFSVNHQFRYQCNLPHNRRRGP